MPKKKVAVAEAVEAVAEPVRATHEQVIITFMNKVMAEVGYVQKKDENKFQKYKYAGEGALLAALRPSMVKHGLVLFPSVKSVSPIDEYGNTHVIMNYTLSHISGAVWPHTLQAAGSGNDRNSKGNSRGGGIAGISEELIYTNYNEKPNTFSPRFNKQTGDRTGKEMMHMLNPSPQEDKLANARNFITTASGILPPSPQQPTPRELGLPPQFAMENIGNIDPQRMPPQQQMQPQRMPLKLGDPTGEYTPEGRSLLFNNQGGKSSEYSVGVKDPRINNKALTHIPSIYDGSILNQ